MKTVKAAITAVGGWTPPDVISNREIEIRINRPENWIAERTGIHERRILKNPHQSSSDMAVWAIQNLLDKRKIKANEIELIICATMSPDMPFPATACLITEKLGTKNTIGFDITAACAGFIYALTLATALIETQKYKKIIVVGAEKMSAILDPTQDSSALFGDGAAAILLEPTSEEVGIMDSILKSDGTGNQYLHMKAGGSLKPASQETIEAREHYLWMDGSPVFKSAVIAMSDITQEIMLKNKLEVKNINWLIPHQANKRIIDAVATKIKLPSEKIISNIARYGNTSAASIPLCLWEKEKDFKKGDSFILTAFGSGFVWGALYLKWAYDGVL